MSLATSNTFNTLRATIAANQASTVVQAAEVLFEAGGKELLGDAARGTVRRGIETAAARLVTESAPHLLVAAAKEAPRIGAEAARLGGRTVVSEGMTTLGQGVSVITREAGREVARTVGKQAVKVAAKEVVKGMGRAAALGGALDGVVGTAEAAYRYGKGDMTRGQAVGHVVKETVTGAAASAAGVGAVAIVVAFTGPIGWGATLLVAGGAAVASKMGMSAALG